MKKQVTGGMICLAFIGLNWGILVSMASGENGKELSSPVNSKQIVDFVLQNEASAIVPNTEDTLQSKGVNSAEEKGPKRIIDDPNLDDAALEKLPKIVVSESNLVLFRFGSFQVSADWFELLEQYAIALNGDLRDYSIVILGHTDSVGSFSFNQELSEQRARAVWKVLNETYSIPRSRMFVKAYGEERPIASNETSKGRAQNRRVEFKFFKYASE